MWRLEFFENKWNMYDAYIFPRPLPQTCRLETTSVCLNTRLVVNKKFSNSHFFIEIIVKGWHLCAHHVMRSIVLHARRPNCQLKSLTHLVFMICWFWFFAFWEEEKHVFNFVPFRPTRYVLKILRCLEVSNRVSNWNKVKNNVYLV